ncbi:MAG: hypothetical protein COV08_03075 [Candidatus Vogelbacteria bacterium CG10_big_fil_rev_8_21_14_0_10_49_38]|uniref:Thioredoxin domain-containing protein n=1 Tax=Candidatus Vogelbacteria bacterium CG10_big_fil_rev_8_21_14_0_10_49_38 TaxID=1975043 RepID=A0A2H0RJ45_9BACT|nr:MAG: hypothetical protein BK006_03080 [bacterium CG10_49_38]PIR45805.1 MAG: hypothetical protein COV08_03075 [Candidatus Vogelbacteria bacterium CG10_big_fil_rev_8_21_14_0_10_49_38]
MKTKTTIIFITIVIIAGIVFFGFNGGDNKSLTNKSDFDKFAHITLIDYNGNTVSLEEFRGKPLVINSWAVWCPFCREELPDFTELQKEFGDRLVVIAIDRQEPLEKAKGFTDELGVTNDMLFLLDASDSFYKSIGGFSMPETIFVNGAGEIVVHKRGPMELDEMREHVAKIIK